MMEIVSLFVIIFCIKNVSCCKGGLNEKRPCCFDGADENPDPDYVRWKKSGKGTHLCCEMKKGSFFI